MSALSASPAAAALTGPAAWLEELSGNGLLRWQHGTNNLGLLLAPLLDITGWQGDVLSLTDALPGTAKAVGEQDILAVMGALGYRIREQRIQCRHIKPEDMPCLFIPSSGKSWRAGIVIREAGPYGVIWDDGRERHRGELPAEEGVSYHFELIGMDARKENAQPTLTWLEELRERFRPLLWHAAILSLIMHFFTLAMPLFSMAAYDRIIGAHALGTLPLLACRPCGSAG